MLIPSSPDFSRPISPRDVLDEKCFYRKCVIRENSILEIRSVDER